MVAFCNNQLFLALTAVLYIGSSTAFVPSSLSQRHHVATSEKSSSLFLSTENQEAKKAKSFQVPLTWEEMVSQAATCMKEAAAAGDTRQIVRILLPRDSTNADFGVYLEQDSADTTDVMLVPPDESWQGGIMQLYRAAEPTAKEMIRKLTSGAGLPPRITEDRSIDESGVDGVGLLTTDDDSVTCVIQPTQEVIDEVIDITNKKKKENIVMLLNPQWRQVDDALDSASQGEGFFSSLASFLGGKGAVLKLLRDNKFTPVYTLEGYVCRGANIRLLQTYSDDSKWQVFCERDDLESYLSIGTVEGARPTYQQVEKLMQDANIGYKYARDVGMEPKL